MKIYVVVILLVLGSIGQSKADLLMDALSFNNLADTLRDDGVAAYYDLDSNRIISSGDILQGMVQIAEVIPDGGGGLPINSLYGAFSMRVSSVVGRDVSFGPGQGSYAISDVLNRAGLSTAGLTNYSGSMSDATFAWLSKPIYFPLSNMDASSNPNDLLITNSAIGNSISAANGWSVSLVTGHVNDDFYKINLNDISYLDLNQLRLTDPDLILAQYRTAQSIIGHSFGPNRSFNPLIVDADFTTGTDTRRGDLISSGNNLFAKPSSIAVAGGWDLSTDGNFKIAAHTPEPTSLILVAISGLLILNRRVRNDGDSNFGNSISIQRNSRRYL